MPLPDLIEIIPRSGPGHAAVTVPGSKSITNRALVLAALADGATTLRGALWSEDTQVMVECLGRLGFGVHVEADPAEAANRAITVRGLGGAIPRAGSAEAPLELFVGNAGTAARFLAAMACLGCGAYRLSGVPRMHERPQAALFRALRELGCRVDSTNDRLPAVIHGTGPRPGRCTVSVAESSQFASALLLSARAGGWEIVVEGGGDVEELPYVEMTRQLVSVFPARGGEFQVEPDASSGSYFAAAGWLLNNSANTTPTVVKVDGWPTTDWQVDARFVRYLPLRPVISRATDLGDSIMTAIVLAADRDGARERGWTEDGRQLIRHHDMVRFTDLGRLRVQECERVLALRTELTRCGARVEESGDTLSVHPATLHGAEIETYNDHRMAMCFAVLGLKVPGLRLRHPACVKKTFPNFFQKLAAPAPHGLGVEIRDAAGRRLSPEALSAE